MYGLKIEIIAFEDLTDLEKQHQPNNGSGGREYANYIRVSHRGETIMLQSDAMEPEDCRFTRDLSWIPAALEKCYEIGLSEPM